MRKAYLPRTRPRRDFPPLTTDDSLRTANYRAFAQSATRSSVEAEPEEHCSANRMHVLWKLTGSVLRGRFAIRLAISVHCSGSSNWVWCNNLLIRRKVRILGLCDTVVSTARASVVQVRGMRSRRAGQRTLPPFWWTRRVQNPRGLT